MTNSNKNLPDQDPQEGGMGDRFNGLDTFEVEVTITATVTVLAKSKEAVRIGMGSTKGLGFSLDFNDEGQDFEIEIDHVS